MLKKEITYNDWDGNERTETFYFNLSQVEVAEMEMSKSGGWLAWVERLSEVKDNKELIAIFKDVLLKSYGEKDLDGRRFQKSEEISRAFSETKAFEKLFMMLAADTDFAIEFFNGIIPKAEELERIVKQNKKD